MLRKLPGLPVLDQELLGQGGVAAVDGGKVTIQVSALGITGPEAAQALREQGIAVELVDQDHVLFLVTYADDTPEFAAVAEKIRQGLEKMAKAAGAMLPVPEPAALPELVLPPRQAFFSRRHAVPFAEAAGEIAGESISFYPPGIPLVVPGERLTQEMLDYCRKLQAKGLLVSGPRDTTLETIEVMDK